MRMRSGSVLRPLIAVALVAAAAFLAITVVVTTNRSLAFDSQAFTVAAHVRAPWLTSAARVVTVLGLIAIVAPALLLTGGVLILHRRRARAIALISGGALAWAAVWITKSLVNRTRPSGGLVHTAGQSYPSAHAANSVGWLALAVAIAVLIGARTGQIVVIIAGAVIAVLVGLSRIYLRAHFASDVLAGYALAVAMYALATIAVIASRSRRWSADTIVAGGRRVEADEASMRRERA
jgi:undecaprenyl-diphosphatase